MGIDAKIKKVTQIKFPQNWGNLNIPGVDPEKISEISENLFSWSGFKNIHYYLNINYGLVDCYADVGYITTVFLYPEHIEEIYENLISDKNQIAHFYDSYNSNYEMQTLKECFKDMLEITKIPNWNGYFVYSSY